MMAVIIWLVGKVGFMALVSSLVFGFVVRG